MTPTTAQEFVGELRRVQLLNAAQLEAAQAAAAGCPTAVDLAERLVAAHLLTEFQASQVLDGFAHDLVLGSYRLMDLIGEGGMGHVFKAFQPRLNRLVALKMIRDDLVDNNPDVVRRFQREATAVAQLRHPNVVILYDADEINGVHFLAMEYIDGVDLARMVLERGMLPVAEAGEYIRQAAEGLQHAYESGLVHRDIKPSNLLVTRGPAPRASSIFRRGAPDTPYPTRGPGGAFGTVKILDMGLARLTDSLDDAHVQSTLTQQGSVIGTPDFIAPEQARDPRGVDIRADIYSLGCTFYYLLVGRPPFPDGTPVEKLLKHQLDSPAPMERYRRDLPQPVVAVVHKMMRREAKDRYQTPQEVVDALDRALGDVSGPLRPEAPPEHGVFAAAPLTPSDVVVSRAVMANQETQRTQAFTVNEFAIPARRKSRLELGEQFGYVTGLAFSADGRFLATGGLDGELQLWDVSGDRVVELKSSPIRLNEVQLIAFSPSEPCLYTGSSALNGHMYRWDYAEKDPRRSLSRVPGEPFREDALAVSRDGKSLAAAAGETVVHWSVSRRDISKSNTLKGHTATIKALAFSPDGKRLASGGEDRKICLWEFGWFRTTQKATLTGHKDGITSLAIAPNGVVLASGSLDHTIRLWDATGNEAEARAVLEGHNGAVRLVQFMPRGVHLLSVGDGGQVILWDVATQRKARELFFDRPLAASLALTPDGRYLAVGVSEGQVHLFDLEQIVIEHMPATLAH